MPARAPPAYDHCVPTSSLAEVISGANAPVPVANQIRKISGGCNPPRTGRPNMRPATSIAREAEHAKLIWARAEGTRWKLIRWRFGIARATAHRHWQYGLSLIAYRLNGRRVPAKRSHRLSAIMATGSDGRASLDAIGGEADGLRTCAIRRD